MAYTTAALLKSYLGVTGSADDTLIGLLITQAQEAIDNYTQRTFEASADTTRKYTVGLDTCGDTLYFDEDICSITSIANNADDGSGGTALTQNTDYITFPRNRTPYHKIRLLSSSNYYWQYTYAPENGITVTGKFAYSTSAPVDIVHATERLVGYYYRQKDSQVFDVTAIPDAGVITIPQGIPADVKAILKPYVRMVY